MNKKIWITGDMHGAVTPRISQLLKNNSEIIPEETMLIALGDVGLNYYLNKKDQRSKREVEAKGVYLYCVRGNHEARPGDIEGMQLVWDENVSGEVWIEEEFPHIRYFKDWGIYHIGGLRTLVIGGAYSVDKYYRIEHGFRWFENEQLSKEEMAECWRDATLCPQFDLMLTHTCPYSVQPVDLFLGFVDQNSVDNTMEKWLEELKNALKCKVHLFGHYHEDRIELPYYESFYTDIETLDDIIKRWENYDKTGKLDWWLPLSPKMKRLMEG